MGYDIALHGRWGHRSGDVAWVFWWPSPRRPQPYVTVIHADLYVPPSVNWVRLL